MVEELKKMSGLTPAERLLVLLVWQNGKVNVGNRMLGELIGVGEYQACKLAAGLEKKGIVKRVRERLADGRTSRVITRGELLTES